MVSYNYTPPQPEEKSKWARRARTFDAWRPFPRLFILFYFYLLHRSLEWFITLENPNNAQAAFISAVVGAGAAWFGLYVNSGQKE